MLSEWRIQDIERSINNKADKHEIYSIRSDVDSMERTVRELSSLVDRFRFELETCKNQITELTNQTIG